MAIAAEPDEDVLALAYARTYAPHSARRGLVERIGEPLAQREASRLAQHADRSRAVLDVGCGTGRFLERLRRAGWRGRMAGLEPAPDVALDTSERLGIQVYAGALDDVYIEPGSFGTIVLRHVIEHVRAPHATLRRISDLLEPHGVLYLATPDTRALAAAVFGRYWHGYDPPRHLFAFSRDGVRRLLAAEGFSIVDERWDFAPQMWTGSMRHALGRGRRPRWAAIAGHDLNPLAAIPAIVAAGAEVALHRSTMYATTARRRS